MIKPWRTVSMSVAFSPMISERRSAPAKPTSSAVACLLHAVPDCVEHAKKIVAQ
jgi:hypothetical protein